jgi:hypothetical protein
VKKASVILLIIIYAAAAFGVGVSSFYCCGKLKSLQISFAVGKSDKPHGGNEVGDNCCKTTHTFFKVRDSHMAGVNGVTMASPVTGLILPVPLFEATPPISPAVTAANRSHAPPLFSGGPIYLRNCVFLI